MACQYIDGFDHYSTATDAGWSAGTISSTNPRSGAQCLAVTAILTRTMASSQATWVFGAAIRPSSTFFTANNTLVELRDSATAQVGVYYNADQTVSIKRGGSAGTVLAGPSAQTITALSYQYVEFKATISDAAGTVEFKVNGVTWLSGSSLDTKQSSNASANVIAVGVHGNSQTTAHDDMYIFDGSGGVNDAFAGDCQVTTLLPSGAGNTTAWTASAGSNYQCVDETTANGDTDYVSSSTATQKDTYVFGDLSGSPTVVAVAVAIHARKDDAGSRSIVSVVRHSGSDYDGSVIALGDNYVNLRQNYDVNPGTSVAWTASDVNGAEFGVKLNA